jgi:hypothetical protein
MRRESTGCANDYQAMWEEVTPSRWLGSASRDRVHFEASPPRKEWFWPRRFSITPPTNGDRHLSPVALCPSGHRRRSLAATGGKERGKGVAWRLFGSIFRLHAKGSTACPHDYLSDRTGTMAVNSQKRLSQVRGARRSWRSRTTAYGHH